MITGPAFENISWKTYISKYIWKFRRPYNRLIILCVIVFACLNAAIIPAVYIFFPGKSTVDLLEDVLIQSPFPLTETAGRSLEGM